MKKAYPLIFMLLAAGCARDEVNPGGVSDPRTIHLEATTTRASAATIGDVEGGFRVFAAAGDISSTRDWYPGIDGTNNHLYTDGQWDFQTPVPWPTEASKYPMSFYAWYPADLNSTNGFSLTANPAATDTELFAEITVGSTAADQTDLLAGKSIAAARPASGNLTMTFEHILSKIDFGIIAGRGMTPEILGLGLGYVGDTRTYDFIAGDWTGTQPSLSAGIMYDYYGTLFNAPGTAVPWSPGTGNDETTGVPFYNAATTPSAAEAHLMLMPQTNPVWDPVMGGWFGPGSGTFVGVYYRMTNANGEDEVGYASARSHPDFVEGDYEGPLYVLAAFPLPADASGNFTWESGKGYTYNIGLGTPGSSNGYLGDYYYFDEEGNYIFLPVTGGIEPGEPINDGVIHVTLDVDNWGDDGGEIPPVSGTEVEVGNVIWAGTNVAAPGVFASTDQLYDGHQYTFDEARTSAVPTGSLDGSVCPAGWRMPTVDDFYNLVQANITPFPYAGSVKPDSYYNDTYYHNENVSGRGWDESGFVNGETFIVPNGTLFFSASGRNSGEVGTLGAYWSSVEGDATYAYRMDYHSTLIGPAGLSYKTWTLSVRCVKPAPAIIAKSLAVNKPGIGFMYWADVDYYAETVEVTADGDWTTSIAEVTGGAAADFTFVTTDSGVTITGTGADAVVSGSGNGSFALYPTTSLTSISASRVFTLTVTAPDATEAAAAPKTITVVHRGDESYLMGVRATPGVIGYKSDGTLTLRGSVECTGTPLMNADGTALVTGLPVENETVCIAYFQFGSLVATDGVEDWNTSPYFTNANIVAWPSEWAEDRAAMETLIGPGFGYDVWNNIPDVYLPAAGQEIMVEGVAQGKVSRGQGTGDPCIYWSDKNGWGDDWKLPTGNPWYKEGGSPYGMTPQAYETTLGQGIARITSGMIEYFGITGAVCSDGAGGVDWSTFLPEGAFRDTNSNGGMIGGGRYWSSTARASDNYALSFGSGSSVHPNASHFSTDALAVRCVPDLPQTTPTPNPVGEVPIPSADGTYTTIWAGSNLNAKGGFATSATDYGLFFQWGRDVAYVYNYRSALPASAADQTGNATWPAATDPCPFGWRLPTEEEWTRFLDVMTDPGGSNPRTFTSSYGSITFPAAGLVAAANGRGESMGSQGRYWAGTQTDANAGRTFIWTSSSDTMSANARAKTDAFSVRCVRTL